MSFGPANHQRSEVFAGNTRLGSVQFDGKRFIAFAADEIEIGRFETSVAAARAVCDGDRRRSDVLAAPIAAPSALISSES